MAENKKPEGHGRGQACIRPASADRPGPQVPGPRGQEIREGQPLCRHGCGLHLAGACPRRQAVSHEAYFFRTGTCKYQCQDDRSGFQ